MASINIDEQLKEAELEKLKAEKKRIESETKNMNFFSFRYILQAVLAGLILAFTIHSWILPVFNTETKLLNMKSEMNSILNEKEKIKLIEEKNIILEDLKQLEEAHASDLGELEELRNQIHELNSAVAFVAETNPEIKETVEKTSEKIDAAIDKKDKQLDNTKKIISLKERDLIDYKRQQMIPIERSRRRK